ncbi:MAG: TRAP transporter small permease subunit [Hyphomicrobiales bacterium]|nr:TRAP transporter small permease subunit [Hyphomicrobiales bacterium]
MVKFYAVTARLSERLLSVAMLMALAMMGVTIYEVVARRVFDAPTVWSNDVTYMLNGSLFLLGAASTLLHYRHVTIDIMADRFRTRTRHLILGVVFGFVLLPILVLIDFVAVEKAWAAFASGERESVSAWEPLLWPYLSMVALGLSALSLQMLVQAVRHLRGAVVGGAFLDAYLVTGGATPGNGPENGPENGKSGA